MFLLMSEARKYVKVLRKRIDYVKKPKTCLLPSTKTARCSKRSQEIVEQASKEAEYLAEKAADDMNALIDRRNAKPRIELRKLK